MPQSLNKWAYVLGNPVNFIDPSGYTWTTPGAQIIRRLKQDFLDSARRHNAFQGILDDNGFAALIASVMMLENRIGNPNAMSDVERNPIMQKFEDIAIQSGCIVSGHELFNVCRHPLLQLGFRWVNDQYQTDLSKWDREKCIQYLQNQHPGLWDDTESWYVMPTVGWGNLSLRSAAGIWDYKEKLGPMRITIGSKEIDIPDPFEPQEICDQMGLYCTTYQPTQLQSYQIMAVQILDPQMNIEYTAAHLEESAVRRQNLGLRPSAFMAAAWHTWGFLTADSIKESRINFGNAVYAIQDIPKALDLWGLTTIYQSNPMTEPDLFWLRSQENGN